MTTKRTGTRTRAARAVKSKVALPAARARRVNAKLPPGICRVDQASTPTFGFLSGYRSAESGLAEIRRAKGSVIAYATAPGSVASDGNGRNGLYTQELLNAMRKPGITIEQVFKEVRKNVLRLSGEKQYTWDSSNIIGDFYFKF